MLRKFSPISKPLDCFIVINVILLLLSMLLVTLVNDELLWITISLYVTLCVLFELRTYHPKTRLSLKCLLDNIENLDESALHLCVYCNFEIIYINEYVIFVSEYCNNYLIEKNKLNLNFLKKVCKRIEIIPDNAYIYDPPSNIL